MIYRVKFQPDKSDLPSIRGYGPGWVSIDGEKVSHEERIMIGHRIRDVEQGPDGAVYLLTDSSDGQLLRLTPAK